MVQKEISVMTSDEVKARLLNVATAYRDERLRNDDFEKALKVKTIIIICFMNYKNNLIIFNFILF